MSKLDPYFFKSLPSYFKENDTYVSGGKGFLERYLDMFQVIAEGYLPDIEAYPDLIDAQQTPDKFVTYLAENFGNPPDTFGDEDVYRDLLSSIIWINKNRGTKESIENFFALLGVTINITIELATYFRHDDGNQHDDPDVHHDGFCYNCVNVSIDVIDPTFIISDLNEATLTDPTRRIVQSILLYFLPINAIVKVFKYNGVTKDISLDNDLVPTPDPGGPLPA